MVRHSAPDPAEVTSALWKGFGGTTGWDVGANCGQTILEMAFAFQRVDAFEPCQDSFSDALRLVSRHGLNASVSRLALSDHDGEVTLAFPGQEQRETGQLVTPGTAGMEWEPADWSSAEQVIVPCVRADTLAAERGMPDFVKVDTEGHELHVLKGATWILSERKTDWLIEFHTPGNHDECERLLREAGYHVETVRHPHYQPDSQMWRQHGWIRAFAPVRYAVADVQHLGR
jgi:FkbM family methyltransferase